MNLTNPKLFLNRQSTNEYSSTTDWDFREQEDFAKPLMTLDVPKDQIIVLDDSLMRISNQLDESLYVDLKWENVCIETRSKLKETNKIKKIIKNSFGNIESGQLLSILGRSGSGKTTLFNTLCGRLSDSLKMTSGNMVINNSVVADLNEIKGFIGYVTQNDILNAHLTPRETLYYVCKLKLSHLKEQEIKIQVDKVIGRLELEHCQNLMVGDNLNKSISGGEQKRLCIGMELLLNPTILFLDEPTTGLDVHSAERILRLLKRLVNSGRVVITTIHQPSSDIFELFDRIIMLHQGYTMYQGKAENIVAYFEQKGYKMPKYNNPCDFFLDILSTITIPENYFEYSQNQNQQDDKLKQQYVKYDNLIVKQSSDESFNRIELINDLSPLDYLKQNQVKETNFCKEFIVMYQRKFKTFFRIKKLILLGFFGSLIATLIGLSLYYNNGVELKDIQNRTSALFFAGMVNLNITFLSSIIVFNAHRDLFLMEVQKNYFRITNFYFSNILVEYPWWLFVCCIMNPLIYWFCNFNRGTINMFRHFIVVVFSALAGQSLGSAVGCLSNDMQSSTQLQNLIWMPSLMLCDFFVNQDTLNVVINPLKYISIHRYTFEALMVNDFDGLKLDCPESLCNPLPYLHIENVFWPNILKMFLLTVTFWIIGVVALYVRLGRFKCRKKAVERKSIKAKKGKNVETDSHNKL